MWNEDIFNLVPKCVLCPTPIPPERLKFRAVTCSEEHGKQWSRFKRRKSDNNACRFCHKPSTPNARKAFSRFRVWERKNPELARPEEWAIFEAQGMTAKEFGKALAQAARNDIEIDLELRTFDWGRVKNPKLDQPTPELDRCLAILSTYEPPAEPVKEADASEEKANV